MITATLLTLTGFVFAEGVGITAKVGTLGLGGELTAGLLQRVNGRLGFNALSISADLSDDEDGVEDVSGDLELQTVSLLLDWHPWKDGGFRLSAGAILNNNEVSLTAESDVVVQLGDSAYLISDLNGDVTFDDIVPYVGLGYGNAVGEGNWHFSFDLGVMFQGEPDVSLSATALIPAQQDALNASIEQEIQDIEEDTEVFTMYPVLSFGLSYKF
jgi:hypothetical protein